MPVVRVRIWHFYSQDRSGCSGRVIRATINRATSHNSPHSDRFFVLCVFALLFLHSSLHLTAWETVTTASSQAIQPPTPRGYKRTTSSWPKHNLFLPSLLPFTPLLCSPQNKPPSSFCEASHTTTIFDMDSFATMTITYLANLATDNNDDQSSSTPVLVDEEKGGSGYNAYCLIA
jgi:hypothetical protein